MMIKFLRDLGKTLLFSISAAAAGFGILFLIGWLYQHSGVNGGLEAAKNGLLVVGSIGLFIVAGMLIARGKNPNRFSDKENWRKFFDILGPELVIGFFAVVFLLAASIADYLLMI